MNASAALDRALQRFHTTDLEYKSGDFDGLSNHGPMAAEALETMGHAESIDGFVDAYSGRLRALSIGRPLSDSQQRQALGDPEHMGDWVATALAGVESVGAETYLRTMAPRLLRGVAAAAVHGVLRTAHAARGLQRSRSDVRKQELAHGLAYWAARYQPLPGRPGSNPKHGHSVAAALAEVPLVEAPQGGLIFDRLGVLEGNRDFVHAVERFDPTAAPPARLLSELTWNAARLYLTQPRGRFVYLHTLTGTSAVRTLLPWLEPEQQVAAVAYAFQAVAALHATHGQDESWRQYQAAPTDDTPHALADRAARSVDDHTIKYVEAATREYVLDSRPEYLAAARHRLDAAP